MNTEFLASKICQSKPILSLWQREIQTLHKNFHLLDPTHFSNYGLSPDSQTACSVMQQTLTETLFKLLSEFENATNSQIPNQVHFNRILYRHIELLNEQNEIAERLIKKINIQQFS